MVSQDLIYDLRDSKIDPTAGFVSRFKTDLSGLGGNRKYVRAKLTGVQYYTPWEDFTFSATGEVGAIEGLGQDVRINDRFFLGGNTLRGFAYGGIGPRDLTGGADDALGGNHFARASLELSFPTFMPKDLGFKGHVFGDAGVLGENDEKPISGELFMSEEKIRASVGVGVSWQSPFGLVRLDYAQPVAKQSYDEIEHVHFSFGTWF
jgi:outer membrane protein insertion porin family